MPAVPTAPRQAKAPKLRSVLAKITLIAAVAGFGYAVALGLLVIRASLAQVHRAVLHDGRQVAVKVQKPEVAAQLRSDLEALRSFALALRRIDIVH